MNPKPWIYEGLGLVLALSVFVCVTQGKAEISDVEIARAMSVPRSVIPIRAKMIGHPDPRPTQGVSLAQKQQGQEAKVKQTIALIEQAAADGFNAVVWIGPNELWAPAPHAIIRHEEFPEARELSSEDNELAIALMQSLFRRAKELGMANLLYTLSIWYTPAFAEAHGYDKPLPVSMDVNISQNLGWPYVGGATNCGVRDELTRAYTEAVFAETASIYEDLDGFYSPIGETVPGQRSSWFREAIAPGLKRSGRRPLIIVHQWEIPLEEYMSDIAPKDVYDNTWLAFHAYNSEQITDAKPYPSLVRWAEGTGLPTVAAVYPANIRYFPFNSPRFAFEIVYEMKRIDNFVGYMYWEHPIPQLSYLFRQSLARYAATDEPYSDDPWLEILRDRYGDEQAAEHFLRAFDISARIMPELYALIYSGNDVYPRELRLSYSFMLRDAHPFSWTTARVRGQPLIPVHHYATMVAKTPRATDPTAHGYLNNNGSDPMKNGYRQMSVWRAEGGSEYDVVPPDHMKRVRAMGEQCLVEAEAALETVKTNREEAERIRDFMEAYRLISRYGERKVAAAVACMIYSETGDPEYKVEAEALADETLEAYLEANAFMQERLAEPMANIYGRPYQQQGKDLSTLIEEEKAERENLGQIFGWEK